MNILHIISSLSSGGAEIYVRDLSMEMARSGHKVCIAYVSEAAALGRDRAFEERYKKDLERAGIGYAEIGHAAENHVVTRPALQGMLYTRLFNETVFAGKGTVEIGSDVWIGDSVIVLSGVHIGDGAVIGAGAVVTKDVPPYAIAVGVPAKVLRMRFAQDIIDVLLRVKWWDWPEEKMKMNREFFASDLSKSDAASLIRLVK